MRAQGRAVPVRKDRRPPSCGNREPPVRPMAGEFPGAAGEPAQLDPRGRGHQAVSRGSRAARDQGVRSARHCCRQPDPPIPGQRASNRISPGEHPVKGSVPKPAGNHPSPDGQGFKLLPGDGTVLLHRESKNGPAGLAAPTWLWLRMRHGSKMALNCSQVCNRRKFDASVTLS